MPRQLIAALLVVGSFGLSMEAQTPRDRSAPAPVGTGRIRGRVVAADSGAPLRRAQVWVGSYELRVNRTVSTDADGRFDVSDLPAGSYSLTVGRHGYASLQFGQQRPFEAGRRLELANGQLIDRIDFALPPGSVITGRVTDQLGEPVPGIHIEAMRHLYLAGGEKQLVPVGMHGTVSVVTHDLGEFRVAGLMPGTYVLRASAGADGGILNGTAPGTQLIGDHLAYATTYYPGTVSPEHAEPISVGVGDMTTASFALSTARLTRVSGTVRDSQGRPVTSANIGLRSRTPTTVSTMTGTWLQGSNGHFSIDNLPPGDYSIEVVPMSTPVRSAANAEFNEVGSVPFTAAGQDITDIVITTTPGATVSGRVIFEGTSRSAKPDRVSAHAPDHRSTVLHRRDGDNGAIDAAGRFQLRGIIGRAIFVTGFAPPGTGHSEWSMKSVTLNGADITDIPLDIPSVGEISGIEIVMTDTPTRLSGTVSNARRETVKDYVVVVLPERLQEGTLPGRFTRTARPNQEGRYELKGLPAGNYLAVAIPTLEFGSEWDPAFRKEVEHIAKRFRLTHGQIATLDLELTP